jgi:sulfur-carrier protein adenylyltransferase/sulfurtransferase
VSGAPPVLPPLVGPGEDLTPEEARRYSRHLLLPEIGVLGQRRLKAARVLVVGAGGLGSPALLYLAAAGVGTIGVVDDDVVEDSNLQRQVLHGTADVGRPKVDSAADAVERTNPLVRVVRHRERLTADSAARLVAGYDLVLDGSDNFATRYLVNDACVLAGTPWVWGAVLRFDGHVSTFWAEHGPTYRDLFPEPPAPGTVPSCGEAGVLGGVCAMVGSVMVTEAVKLVTGSGRSLLGRVLVLDALSTTWRTLALRADPARPAVTAITAPPPAPRREEPELPAITPAELAERLRAREAGDEDFLLVDVREPEEHAAHAIPGAVLVPLRDLLDAGALAGVARDRPLVLHCASGARSARALLALTARGHTDVRHLQGGITAWTAAGMGAVAGAGPAA